MESNKNTKAERGSSIAYFAINKLHGNRYLRVDFDNDIKIVIAENGVGKTTLIKLLVGVLSGSMARANLYKFESVEIGFYIRGELKFEVITAQEFSVLVSDSKVATGSNMGHVRASIGSHEYENLLQIAAGAESVNELRSHPAFVRADQSYLGPTAQFVDELRAASASFRIADSEKLRAKQLRSFIDSNFPFDVIYWPTYRRIEDELEASGLMQDLGRWQRPAVDALMNFGMDDIENQIKEFTDSIRSSTVRQFQVENAKMLSALALQKVPSAQEIETRLARTKDLELVLSRLRSAIETPAREQIDKLISSGDIFKLENKTLALLLSNLVLIYDDTKQNDEQIKRFVHVCNDYLTDKAWVYDDISVTLEVVTKQGNVPIKLNRLSSGEKQLTSMLARLYLAPPRKKKTAIFIDEPELSLSLEWQRKLLPNILNSHACDFLFVITHSPFIFQNELVSYVEPLNVKVS